MAFLVPRHSPSVLLTPGLTLSLFHLCPMGLCKKEKWFPSSSHLSFCKELQLVHSCKRAKHVCMLHSGSPALAAALPKYFPCSFILCMHSLFPKVQDSLPELTLTQKFGLFVGWLFFVLFCFGFILLHAVISKVRV